MLPLPICESSRSSLWRKTRSLVISVSCNQWLYHIIVILIFRYILFIIAIPSVNWRWHRSCRNMSFFKFKSLVLFIKIVTKLLLLRPFGILIYCCYCSDAECPLLTLTVSRLCLWPREQRSHYPGEISKRKNHQSFFNLCSRKTRARGSRDYRDDICFEKLRFQINKLTSVFHASVLLLIMNFVITLSK